MCRSEARTVFSKQRTPAVLLSEVSKNIMQCFCGDRANGFSLPLARRTRAIARPSGDRVRSASDATLRRVPFGKPQNRHVNTLMATRRWLTKALATARLRDCYRITLHMKSYHTVSCFLKVPSMRLSILDTCTCDTPRKAATSLWVMSRK